MTPLRGWKDGYPGHGDDPQLVYLLSRAARDSCWLAVASSIQLRKMLHMASGMITYPNSIAANSVAWISMKPGCGRNYRLELGSGCGI